MHLNAAKTALVVIDLQEGIVQRDLAPYSGAQVVQNAKKLADAFRAKGSFVVLVKVAFSDGNDSLQPCTDAATSPLQFPSGWDRLVTELANINGTHIIIKRQWGAFYGTELDLQLRRRGIDTLVLCGISTSLGVDTTAREAFQHAYHQFFAEDAMTASSTTEHDYVCRYIFPRLGRIRSCAEITEMLK